MQIGLVWFGATSLLCALAPNGTFLIVSRALQGVGGALLVPSSLALIISAFKGPAQGKAIGTLDGLVQYRYRHRPLVGGLILSVTSWRWIFAVNVLPIAVTLWLMAGLEQPERIKTGTRIDWWGAVLGAVGLGAPVFALIEQPDYGWGSPVIWPFLAAGVVVLALFLRHERRSEAPMLPLSLFRVRNFSAGNVATLAIYAGLSVSSFLITITLQQVGGYSALQASLATLPTSIVMFLLSRRFGRWQASTVPGCS